MNELDKPEESAIVSDFYLIVLGPTNVLKDSRLVQLLHQLNSLLPAKSKRNTGKNWLRNDN